MLIAVAVTLWILCGLTAVHLAFAAARSHQEPFDPIHIWLAVLGPISLIPACFAWAERSRPAVPESRAVRPALRVGPRRVTGQP